MSNLKATTEDLRHAYRLLLGREPDDAGFASLKEYIDTNRPKAPEVAALFFSSPEFKSRHDAVPVLDEIDFNGLKLYPWRGDNLIGDLIKSSGEYESYMLPLFVDSIPIGGTVLDVGANIGTYTLSAARKAGKKGRVFAVEPVAKNVQSICAGVVGNGFRNVNILPLAASGEAGIMPILRNSNSSNGIVDTYVSPAVADGFVPTQRIDFLLEGLDRLDVVKIDIEGHEPVAWPGIETLIRKHRPIVFTEFNPVAIRNHSRVEPEVYLDQLFASAVTIHALHLDGSRVICSTPAQVVEEWRNANSRMSAINGYHLDLVMKT